MELSGTRSPPRPGLGPTTYHLTPSHPVPTPVRSTGSKGSGSGWVGGWLGSGDPDPCVQSGSWLGRNLLCEGRPTEPAARPATLDL